MRESSAFGLLRAYSTLWMRSRSRVVVDGTENLPSGGSQRRTYIVINHSTSYDLVALMHISATRFSVVMDEGAFRFPVVRRLFAGAGFIPLVKGAAEKAVQSAVEKVLAGVPVIMSLTEGGSAIGEEERPRTGGVRIAHLAGALIYPVFTMVEEDKKRHLQFKGVDGKVHPFTTFRDTIYIVDFLPPIATSGFPEGDAREHYAEVALRMRALADAEKRKYERLLADPEGRLAELRRSGGTRVRVTW